MYIPEIGRITSTNDVYFDERSFTLLGGIMSNVKLRGGIRTQNITPPAPAPTTPALPGTAPPVVVDDRSVVDDLTRRYHVGNRKQ